MVLKGVDETHKANLKALNKQYEQEYGRASNPYSRWRQNQAIKKEYAAAKAGNGARNTVKASETTAKAAKRAAARHQEQQHNHNKTAVSRQPL